MTFNYFWRHTLRRVLVMTAPLWNDQLYLKLKFLSAMGYWCNFKNPQTFCEKIQWLKLNNRKPEFTKMVDKVEVKKYVASIIGQEYIIPTLGVWNKFEDIDFSRLPNGFILKCAHDSSKGIVVRDKELFDKRKAKKRIEYFQKKNYYWQNREYPYRNVPHRILAEIYLQNGNDPELIDYKFYCFGGTALFCQLIKNRSTDETIDFYDRQWQRQPFTGLQKNAVHAKETHHAPDNYCEMFEIADKLASQIKTPFVRIDLYNVNGKIFFGEITFFPNSGMGNFHPSKWNVELGNLIHL